MRMKRIVWGVVILLGMLASCSEEEDNPTQGVEAKLVSPRVSAMVENETSSYSPLTGVLEAYPCKSQSSIYFGNYVQGKLSPFYGYYMIQDGHVTGDGNRVLNLPEGSYNMIYWGTPKYEEPTYSTPAISEPAITIGGDLSQQYFGLRSNGDGTYMPVYDMVHAVKEMDTDEDFQASLRRVVAGLKVIVKQKDNGIFDSDILKMRVEIGGISEKLNVYTAEPENPTKTVKFDLVRSEDGTSMSNATVMLFPSAEHPMLDLVITTQDGKEHRLTKELQTTLSANTRLTLQILLGEVLPSERKGNFTIENWREATETIEFIVEE